ncbi:guanine deaminase, a catabolic enzyme of the guanine salvage pathway [Coemansia reversa NRRL 1564]|uniref:Guanine deaminase n=1 Tax=Coemansia reversa (strain ATCC 12441 / NRRL 1564) TaxID=763665 RepID=A0A2G5BEA7_COERN|nr:guanine deaminase, a catabolic enzyme of the guanine salvage pathway [Coemansia reversa NRRL 1564]|eukprot:PIA17331.1 guanine deaminase, a catabolic enzyme of the guanine salvage pathway [Coemansia reversa NRRL 1564]
MSTPEYYVFRGCLIDTPELGTLRIRHNAALGVSCRNGRIIGVTEQLDPSVSSGSLVDAWTGNKVDESAIETVNLGSGQFLMPGLIDTHTHAPQFTFLGLGHDLPLMEWLEKYTFKHESEFQNPSLARTAYKDVIQRVIRGGCTMAAYFGTIHLEANCILAETIREAGQRAFVGKVCMDVNSPAYYSESTEESLQTSETFVRAVLGENNADDDSVLVRPIITPRFVPTCSDRCLRGLGELAHKRNLAVQSHLCENPSETAFAKECFPEAASYAAIYDNAGLLGPRTIMAHCVHMSDDDMRLMRESGAGVSHCPNSNFALSSGIADVRRFLDQGIPVGLGTDVGAGYTPSIIDAMRMAAAANRALIASSRDAGTEVKQAPLNASELLFLATQGGARVMGMQSQLGSLDPGKFFDALVVDLDVPNSPVPSVHSTGAVLHHQQNGEPELGWNLRAEQFVFLADDRNIARVYVAGKLIHSL